MHPCHHGLQSLITLSTIHVLHKGVHRDHHLGSSLHLYHGVGLIIMRLHYSLNIYHSIHIHCIHTSSKVFSHSRFCQCTRLQAHAKSPQDFSHAHIIGLFMSNVSLFTINFPNHYQLSNSINHRMSKLSLTSHSAYHSQEHLCYCQSNLCHCFVVVTTMSLLCYISVKLTLVMIAFKLSFHQRI